jgi:hypothetical protein
MNPTELFYEDGRSSGAFVCSECKRISPSHYLAENCCKPKMCTICGEACEGYWLTHPECTDQKRFEKAEKIHWTNYNGPVFWNETLHMDLYEFADDVVSSDDGYPEYVHPTITEPFPGIDLSRAIENMTEEMFEDAADHLVGVPDLQKAVDAFNDANKDLVTYREDMKRVVILDGFFKEPEEKVE